MEKKRRSSIALEAALYGVASIQNGYFTSEQLQKIGYDLRNSSYFIKSGNWQRPIRGVYRLANFPFSEEEQYTLWSLWIGLKESMPIGVYSHVTALSMYGLSEVINSKLQITVPKSYKTNRKIPKILEIFKEDIDLKDIEYREGYAIASLKKTLRDIAKKEMMQLDHLASVLHECHKRHFVDKNFIYETSEFSSALPYITTIKGE